MAIKTQTEMDSPNERRLIVMQTRSSGHDIDEPASTW